MTPLPPPPLPFAQKGVLFAFPKNVFFTAESECGRTICKTTIEIEAAYQLIYYSIIFEIAWESTVVARE